MNPIRRFQDTTASDAPLVGGKGLNLGLLARAGFAVPPGFILTAEADRSAGDQVLAEAIRGEILTAYRALGGGLVAVRSSALDEDGAEISFAGQQETLLGVEGEDALLAAIERCRVSLHSERAVAYRAKQAAAATQPAMAVVVQRLVNAETAGVLFTTDPLDPTGANVLIEASYGLGEMVVSGRVTPDRFHVRRADGTVIDRKLGRKAVERKTDGEHPVALDRQAVLCLTDAQLAALAELARRVESYYQGPRDVEWAIAQGQIFLLQARPITTPGAAEREAVRRRAIETVRNQAEGPQCVWVRGNVAETLPAPLPMTWGLIERHLSGNGAVGLMERDFGGSPDPALNDRCEYDLIAGRLFWNLPRSLRLQMAKPPFEFPIAEYRRNPSAALMPEPILRLRRYGLLGLRHLPGWFRTLGRIRRRTRRLATNFAARFLKEIVPPFTAEVRAAEARDWAKVDPPALCQAFEAWAQRTLIDFARDSLKPASFVNLHWQTIRQKLSRYLAPDRLQAAFALLSQGATIAPEADVAAARRALADGSLSEAEFLSRFGHRGNAEMELAEPRWREVPEILRGFRTHQGVQPSNAGPTPWDRVIAEAGCTPFVKNLLTPAVEEMQRFIGMRETAKHFFLMGYALLRRILLELDARFGLNGGIFYLTPKELPDLLAEADVSDRIAERKRLRRIELTLEVPLVLFADDAEAIGRPTAPAQGELLHGIPLSPGAAEGRALVLMEPTAPPEGEAFILVCPSTDPAWVPLFAAAKGVIMETGGILSHGAIVAREFGLPAVAGLPGILERITTGARVRVDGNTGTVALVESV